MMWLLRAETQQIAQVPLLLVDIDGVLSLWGWPPDAPPDGAWTLVDGIAHFLAAAPAAHLRGLAEDYELVWCSGWEEKANDYLPQLLGIGPLAHLHFAPPRAGSPTPEHWKLAAIDAYAGPHRPVAWVDDALDAACHRWARARPGPTLLVTTSPSEGLTAAHARELAAWAAAIQA